MANLRRYSLYGVFEAWSPLFIALSAFFAFIFFKSSIVILFINNELSLPQLYTAIFGWSSVMTGFQFGVYSLIFSKNDGFIAKILPTVAMRRFMTYTKRAVILGFILTIFGMPFLVSNSEMKNINNLMYWTGSAYVSLFVYSFAATARVAALFAAMAKVRSRTSLPA
ncbi:hypothetical protein U8607_18070 [Methylobacterium durans]|uniref:hypothetical protein n=1 Tax=Methylobacterium durans TaxID=2202825 RepID=UPI002AFEC633|nr:hypothetical protein [Methylobacterium durans]MEA1833998.1 hypothetical protein [Methylobacterium durans]